MERTGEESKKIPEYMKGSYTEVNPLDLKAKEGDKEITLMTYRLAVPDGITRKGIVFFFSGFGAYCEHASWMFKHLSQNGYEIIAMDYRGFGNSEGTRAYFISEETLYNDCKLLFDKTIEKYSLNPSETPFFLLGISLGGMLSYILSIKHQNYFKAISSIVPALRAPQKALYKMTWLIKTISYFKPTLSLPGPKKGKDPTMDKYEGLFSDSKLELKPRIQSIAQLIDMQNFAAANVEKATTPIIMFTAGKDTMVCTKSSEEIFHKINNPLNKLVHYPESDHISVVVEKDEVEAVMKETVEFFDKILQQI